MVDVLDFDTTLSSFFLFFNSFLKAILENNVVEDLFRKLTRLGESSVTLATRESPMTLATYVKKMVRSALFQPLNSLPQITII